MASTVQIPNKTGFSKQRVNFMFLAPPRTPPPPHKFLGIHYYYPYSEKIAVEI